MQFTFDEPGNRDTTARRIAARREMRAPAWLETEAGQSVDTVVFNMNEEGLELEVPSGCRIPLYSVCLIQVGGFFSAQSIVIWRASQKLGMLISSPIHASVIASLAKRYPAPSLGADVIGVEALKRP